MTSSDLSPAISTSSTRDLRNLPRPITWPGSSGAERIALWRANARVGALEHRAMWPLPVYLLGHLVPTVLGLLVYVLIGLLGSGDRGMVFAYVGCVVLAVRGDCLSAVSDIPVEDAALHRYHQVRRGALPAFIQYTGRAVADGASAVLAVLVTAMVLGSVVGAATGDWAVIGRVLLALPLLTVTIPSAIVVGLTATAPAIGNDYQNLVHNTVAAVVTICSGAVFPTTINPVLDAVAQVMPLHHTVLAMRDVVAGAPLGTWLAQLAQELAVGLGWGVVGLVVYRWFDHRGRVTGRGAFTA